MQSYPSEEKDNENQVGERCRHIHNLSRRNVNILQMALCNYFRKKANNQSNVASYEKPSWQKNSHLTDFTKLMNLFILYQFWNFDNDYVQTQLICVLHVNVTMLNVDMSKWHVDSDNLHANRILLHDSIACWLIKLPC